MSNPVSRWWQRRREAAAPITLGLSAAATPRGFSTATRGWDIPVYSALMLEGCEGVHYFDLGAIAHGLDGVPADEVSDRVVVRTEQLASLSPAMQAAVMPYERVPGGRRAA